MNAYSYRLYIYLYIQMHDTYAYNTYLSLYIFEVYTYTYAYVRNIYIYTCILYIVYCISMLDFDTSNTCMMCNICVVRIYLHICICPSVCEPWLLGWALGGPQAGPGWASGQVGLCDSDRNKPG